MITKITWIFSKNIHLEVVDETEKAYLVLVLWGPDDLDGRQVWIPKSQVNNNITIEETESHVIIDAFISTWYMRMMLEEYAPTGVN